MASLESRITQYKSLKGMRRTLDARLEKLRSEILPDIGDGPVLGLKKQTRDVTTLNEEVTWEILDHLHAAGKIKLEDYTRVTLDPSKIEGLYLEGVLSDNDLRQIREPKYVEALVEVKEDDVQD